MKFSKFSPEVVAELLIHLADNENFTSPRVIKKISKEDIQGVLRELADHVRESSKKRPVLDRTKLKRKELTENASKVLSELSTQEETILYRSFKIA